MIFCERENIKENIYMQQKSRDDDSFEL